MPPFRDFIVGPWRAVPVLGVTQVLAWGTMFYPPVLTVPRIAADRGWSIAFAMAGFSLGLLVAGLVSPRVGRLIDRYGGHVVMPFGALLGAAGLAALVLAENPLAYLAVWLVLGAAMAGSLYDPGFATLGRLFGAGARPAITALTLIAGFASTVSWPLTHLLMQALGWRGTYLVFAGLMAIVAAPLLAFALPRRAAPVDALAQSGHSAPAVVLPPHGLPFLLVATAFAAYAFVPSGLAAHFLAIFQRAGIDSTTAVVLGALFGPAQVLARILEFVFARNVHPLWIARFAVGLLLIAFMSLAAGITTVLAAAFAIMFGMANGLMTIARGTVPLSLFGPSGYGHLLGRIAGPYLIIQSAAPVVMAFLVERASDRAALACAAAFAALALVCFLAIRRPGTHA
jgi:MFS family permease